MRLYEKSPQVTTLLAYRGKWMHSTPFRYGPYVLASGTQQVNTSVCQHVNLARLDCYHRRVFDQLARRACAQEHSRECAYNYELLTCAMGWRLQANLTYGMTTTYPCSCVFDSRQKDSDMRTVRTLGLVESISVSSRFSVGYHDKKYTDPGETTLPLRPPCPPPSSSAPSQLAPLLTSPSSWATAFPRT